MRKIPLLFLTALFYFNIAFAQIGIGTQTPDSSAQLDVFSTDKGFLPPRVALSATNIAAPVSNPAQGLLIYNTATAGADSTAVIPGYYYWNGTCWYPVVNKANNYGDMQYWDGSKWIIIPFGVNGQILKICNNVPTWGPCYNTLTLQPAMNPYDGYTESLTPNNFLSSNSQFHMTAWTANGNFLGQRSMIKFDLSSISSNAIIDSARLYIYATPTPLGGNTTQAHIGSANSCVVSRITSGWTLPTPFTWNNTPSFSSTNQAYIPQSTSSFENNIIDVTGMVSDMVMFGNNGFHFALQAENIYNIRQYASSRHSDFDKHPKLVVYYHY